MPGEPSHPARISRVLLILLVIATLLRVGLAATQPGRLTQDRDAYLGIAAGLDAGRGWVVPGTDRPTAFRPPLYPLLLAAAQSTLSPAVSVMAVNLAATWVTLVAVYATACLLIGRRAAALPALLLTFDPLLNLYSVQPMTEVPCTALVAVALWLVARASSDRAGALEGWRWPALMGLVLGLLVMCRPTLWPWSAAVVAWSLLRYGRLLRRGEPARLAAALGRWGVLVAAFLAPPVAWAVRNHVVLGTPSVTTTHGGYTLFLANNETYFREVAARRGDGVWDGNSLDAWQQAIALRYRRELGPNPDEVSVDRWMSEQAWQAIRAEPRLFLAACLQRGQQFWSLAPQTGSEHQLSSPVRSAVVAWYLAFWCAAGAGAAVLLRRGCPAPWGAFLFLIVSLALVHMVYWSNARMRAPAMPVLALLAIQGALAVVSGLPNGPSQREPS